MKMNRLDLSAFTMARQYKENVPYEDEKGFIEGRKVPYIQRQAFAERAHYYWLCLTRGVAI